MKNSRKKECDQYKGERVIPELPAGKGGFYIRGRSLVAAVALICIAVIAIKSGFFESGGGLEKIFENLGVTDADSGDGDREALISEEESEATESESKETGEIEEEESRDTAESSEKTDTEKEDKDTLPVTADLSCAEMGDAYIVNYSKQNPDTEGILEMGFLGGKYAYTNRPVVLILHTYTSETYWDYDANNPIDTITKSVVSVGEAVAQRLNSQGIPTVHCAVIHDGDSRVNPYESAEETIETMLKIYPSIEYVVDLRRMEAYDSLGRALRTESSLKTAQVRISVSNGGVLVRDTLAMALELRRDLNKDGARVCLPVVFTDSEYNAMSAPYYLKVDIGSIGNRSDEAVEAGRLFADTLAEILKK